MQATSLATTKAMGVSQASQAMVVSQASQAMGVSQATGQAMVTAVPTRMLAWQTRRVA